MLLTIKDAYKIYTPILTDSLTWETHRSSSPGKITFEIVKTEEGIPLEEGQRVELTDGNTKVFKGYIFKIEESKAPTIKVTAYDQLRYFKNKDSIAYTKLTAGQLLQKIAGIYSLKVGKCDDTGYGITRVEEGTELFGMMQSCIEDTLIATGNMYVLWDDFGELRISALESLRVPVLITANNAGDYAYVRSIDDKFFNQIKLVYENDGNKEYYMIRDSESINKYGLLQLYETVQKKDGIKSYLDKLLKTFNNPVRTLNISQCMGDMRVRGGTSVLIPDTSSDEVKYHYMIVESAKHTWKDGVHLMNLKLMGGEING